MTSVLVLDDHAIDRELLSTVLGYAGYEVWEASTGEQALAMIRTKPPDLIIADILAPQIDGYAFVHELRGNPTLASIPVVFCTATYAIEEVRQVAEACGISQILVQASEPDEIVAVVEEALGSPLGPGPSGGVQFRREHLRVLNAKLLQKVTELELANAEQHRLHGQLLRAEQESAESLTLLETLQSTAPVGFGFIDRNLYMQQMNETLAAMSGTRVEEQLGKRVDEIAPEIWSRIEPSYRKVLDTKEALVNQQTNVGEPGVGNVWLASYYPVRVDGEIIGIGLVVIDITERTNADELRSVVLENMAEGLCVEDGEGRLVFMNSAASSMLGWSEEELRGKPVHETIHFQHADGTPFPEQACPLRKVRTDATTAHALDDTFTTKNGALLPVAYSAAPLGSGDNIRGAVVVFRDISEEKAAQARAQRELNTLTWVGRIREALDEDRLVLYSQPIMPLKPGLLEGEELLLRMVGRDSEIIPPGAFLPSAERYGQIREIDRWVVTQAIGFATSGRRVDVNLSAESVGSGDLLPLIETELQATGADPANLVFELTETALMLNLDQGEAFARRLVDLGCSVALDDFGTGFGGFTYLKNLPIDYLKIDIEFVRELRHSTANQRLVNTIVDLATGFGQKTIAEGVEDQDTLQLLREYGVDFAQGYHLARPGPIPARRFARHEAPAPSGRAAARVQADNGTNPAGTGSPPRTRRR